MRFHTKFFILLALITATFCSGQSEINKIIKVTYTSSPISQYKMTDRDMVSSPSKASEYAFMNGITDYYSLYIKLKDRSSVYVLDSTVQIRPMGWENTRTTAALADTVLFTLKTDVNKTLKHEWIMNQTFFSEGEVGDIQWKLSNETKTIAGLNCYKATANTDTYPMLTVWYTKDLPVSNGPSVYQGLPGLIVFAEDYFRTIEILNVTYTDEVDAFDKLYDAKFKEFENEKERKKYYDKEPLLLVKKGDLARSYFEYFHNKPYKEK